MSELASIQAQQRGSDLVVRIAGEIDISNASEVSSALEEVVPNGTPAIVVDLSRVTYLDSAGVKLLMHLADRLRLRRRELRLVVPDNAPIRAVLELTGLLRMVASIDDSA
jgi:anti-anti-sigma factor